MEKNVKKGPRMDFIPFALMFVLNGKLSIRRTRELIQDIYDRGVRSVIPIPETEDKMGCRYLSPEYFRQFGVMVEECARRSMEMWIWDELYCPSGRAGGLVLKEKPGLRARSMERIGRGKGKGGIFAEGGWVYRVKENKDIVALTDAGSGETFVRLTHEAYRRHFGKYFGSVIKGFFCDEPFNFAGLINGLCSWKGRDYKTAIPWPADIERIFLERYGYDLRRHIPSLFYYEGECLSAQRAREDFARLLTSMLHDNFLLPIKKWCEENNVLFSGHFNNDDLLERHLLATGDLLFQLKTFDVPGIDIICQQIMPDKEKAKFHPASYNAFPYNTNMAKFASSAARQNGRPFALSEIMATFGCGVTIEETKWVMDHHLVRGVNFFTPSTSEYTWGADNLGFVAAFGFKSPQWLFMPELVNYFNGFLSLTSRKKEVINTAVWYPVASIWRTRSRNTGLYFEALMEYLLINAEDFDIVSPNEMDGFKTGRDYFRVGAARYYSLVLPPIESISERERDFLENLGRKARVYAPAALCLKNSMPYAPDTSRPYHRIGNPIADFAKEVYADLGKKMSIDGPCTSPFVRVKKFRGRSGELFFVFNESGGKPFRGHIAPGTGKPARLIKCLSGGFFSSPLKYEAGKGYCLELAPQETVFISTERRGKRSLRETRTAGRIKMKGKWQASIVSEIGWNGTEYYIEKTAGGTVPVRDIKKLFDWKRLFGRSFSGWVAYKNEFSLDTPSDLVLSIETLKYAAKVYVNGRYAGSTAWRPFEIVIPGKLATKGVNSIRIDVYNTLANIARSPETKKIIRRSGTPRNYYIYSEPFDRRRVESGISGIILYVCKNGAI